MCTGVLLCSDPITADFYSQEENVNVVVESLNGTRSRCCGVLFSIVASILPPSPQKESWESFFVGKPFDQLEVGYRPDTVIVSGIPEKWFQMNSLKPFFQSFGALRWEWVGDVTVGIMRWSTNRNC